MKNELVKSLGNPFKSLLKKPVHNKFPPNEKYISSQKRIKALELAYQKKENENTFPRL